MLLYLGADALLVATETDAGRELRAVSPPELNMSGGCELALGLCISDECKLDGGKEELDGFEDECELAMDEVKSVEGCELDCVDDCELEC